MGKSCETGVILAGFIDCAPVRSYYGQLLHSPRNEGFDHMYAIVSTGGKQYKVAKGDVIDVEKLDAQPGDQVSLDVLLLADGSTTTSDPEALSSEKVVAKVVDQHKAPKVTVFKFHKRKRYQRTRGHRQQLTTLEIVEVPGDLEAPVSASTAE